MSFWKVRKFSRLPINCRVFFSPNGTGAAVWQRKRKQHAFVKSAAMWVGLWGSKHGPCFQRAHWFNSEAFCPSLHFELFCPSCHSWNQPFAMESTCPRVGYKPETFRNCDQRGSDRTKELLIVPNSVGDIWPVKFDLFFGRATDPSNKDMLPTLIWQPLCCWRKISHPNWWDLKIQRL